MNEYFRYTLKHSNTEDEKRNEEMHTHTHKRPKKNKRKPSIVERWIRNWSCLPNKLKFLKSKMPWHWIVPKVLLLWILFCFPFYTVSLAYYSWEKAPHRICLPDKLGSEWEKRSGSRGQSNENLIRSQRQRSALIINTYSSSDYSCTVCHLCSHPVLPPSLFFIQYRSIAPYWQPVKKNTTLISTRRT